MKENLVLDDSAARLRAAFDRSFADAPAERTGGGHELLAIRVGSTRYAVPVAGVASLQADRKVVAVPGAPAGLAGVASVRGALIPVYTLAHLLGIPGSGAPRWIATVRGNDPLALSFDELDGFVRVPAVELADSRGHVSGAVHTDRGALPLIDLASIREALTRAHTES